MQADRGLPGAGGALHTDGPRQLGADDHVLLRLDRRHDVAHRADPRPLDLGLEDRGVLLGLPSGQVLVLVRREAALLEAVSPAQGHAHRLGAARAIEGSTDRRPPVDHHRLTGRIGDVPPSDVEHLADLVVDPPEEQRDRRVVRELFHPKREGRLEVLPAHPVARRRGVQRRGALPHPGELSARRCEVRLLRCQLDVGLGSGLGHAAPSRSGVFGLSHDTPPGTTGASGFETTGGRPSHNHHRRNDCHYSG